MNNNDTTTTTTTATTTTTTNNNNDNNNESAPLSMCHVEARLCSIIMPFARTPSRHWAHSLPLHSSVCVCSPLKRACVCVCVCVLCVCARAPACVRVM